MNKCKYCDSEVSAREMCKHHYLKFYKENRGKPEFEETRRMRKWGEGSIRKCGHKYITKNRSIISEQRYLMEEHIGRKLTVQEVVHHINGNKLDNRIENLKVLTRAEHAALHNPKRKAECHPDKWVYGHSLCKNCYQQKRRRMLKEGTWKIEKRVINRWKGDQDTHGTIQGHHP